MSDLESPYIEETHTRHLEHFDALVEIDSEGNARLRLRHPDEGVDDLVLDSEDYAEVIALWEHATRADA